MIRTILPFKAVVAVVVLLSTSQCITPDASSIQVSAAAIEFSGSFSGIWFSQEDTTPLNLVNDSILEGDRITLVGTFHDENFSRPVIMTSCELILGNLIEFGGALVIPDSSGWDFWVNLDNFAWCHAPGIKTGDFVRIVLNFTNEDCDMMAWWADTDNTTWTYGSNLLGSQAATNSTPELATFTAERDGTIAVGVRNYAATPGNYSVTVDTRVGIECGTVDGNNVTVNTVDYLDENTDAAVSFFGWFDEENACRADYDNVTFVNYFAPHVLNVSITGESTMKFIQWTIVDRNSLDTHTSDVYFSSDEGVSFQLLSAGIQGSNYTWDSTGFYVRDYGVMVRVTDSHGLTGSGVFIPYSPPNHVPWTSLTSSATTSTTTGIGPSSTLGLAVTVVSWAAIVAVLILSLRAREQNIPKRM